MTKVRGRFLAPVSCCLIRDKDGESHHFLDTPVRGIVEADTGLKLPARPNSLRSSISGSPHAASHG